jgi:hypothetical protein
MYQQILAVEMRHLNAYLDHLPKVEVLARAAPAGAPQQYAGLSKVCKGEVQLLIGPPK